MNAFVKVGTVQDIMSGNCSYQCSKQKRLTNQEHLVRVDVLRDETSQAV